MAKLMGKEITIFFVQLCIYQLAYAAITPQDTSYTAEKGKDFNIPWSYDNEANMDTVDWTYKSSLTATPTTIMSKVGTAAETVFNKYNVEYVNNGENGEIRLKSVTSDNAGIYYCEVNYDLLSGQAPVTGTVTLSVTGCKCDCEECKRRVWICISFSCIGIAPEVIFVVGLLIASFRKTNLVVFAAIVIVIEIISGGVCISVPAEKCCTECCENWYKPSSIGFAVVSFLVGVAGIAEFVLVLSNRIGPGRNAYKAKEAKEPGENHGMTGTSM